jgi:hypothetical protein
MWPIGSCPSWEKNETLHDSGFGLRAMGYMTE